MTKVPGVSLAIAAALGLPLLGVLWSGQPLGRYLEFPPRTSYVQHEPFSWPVFIILALLIILSVGPILLQVLLANHRPVAAIAARNSAGTTRNASLNNQHRFFAFPWWGWFGLAWTVLWWILAWTRFPWMAVLQEHTFTPLWLGYIVIVNAWTFARTGHCMMLHRPRYYLSLFPLSAAFWWFFEYLNRFVQNWYYVGVADLSPLEYFLRGTIPFSTVLPAVIGTADLVASYSGATAGLKRFKAIRIENVRLVSGSAFALASVGLLGMGLFPNYLFPLVWVGPLLLVVSLQALAGQGTILSSFAWGDWREIWVPALAGLICGLFWELWNWKSLAHWQYAIPFVHRFNLFEMPLLGYAGYLPFGVQCVVLADLCLRERWKS